MPTSVRAGIDGGGVSGKETADAMGVVDVLAVSVPRSVVSGVRLSGASAATVDEGDGKFEIGTPAPSSGGPPSPTAASASEPIKEDSLAHFALPTKMCSWYDQNAHPQHSENSVRLNCFAKSSVREAS